MCKSDGAYVLRQDGLTALFAAAADGHVEVVQTLLLAGVNKEAAVEVGCRGACCTLALRAVINVTQS